MGKGIYILFSTSLEGAEHIGSKKGEFIKCPTWDVGAAESP